MYLQSNYQGISMKMKRGNLKLRILQLPTSLKQELLNGGAHTLD